MKIKHERAAGIFDAFGESRGVFGTVVAVARVDPGPQPKTRPAVLHEQPDRIARMIAVHINPAAIFDLSQTGDVSAEVEVGEFGCAGVYWAEGCEQPQ